MKTRTLRRVLFAGAAIALLAACSQGSDIESPGAADPGTPPGGGAGSPPPPPAGPTVGLIPAAGCPDGSVPGSANVNGVTVQACEVSGVIAANLEVPAGVTLALSGPVFVGDDVGAGGTGTAATATLTLGPGARLVGNSGSDYLVINRGSRIIAEGSANNPVIFTSKADVVAAESGTPRNGSEDNMSEWGGIVILGRAPLNRCRDAAAPGTAACENIVEGVTNPEALYGGGDPNDSSGVLRYVQVRFAGFAVNTQGNELNGITFAGVGRNTQVDHIQVHNNSDDGVEFFGGNVNIKHLVLTGNDDDSIDTDNGWQGKIQHVVVVQRSGGGDNIVEASSSAPGVTPLSGGTIANFTFVGRSGGGNAFRLNTGTVGRYVNGVVDHPGACMRWESSAGDGTAGFSASGDPTFQSVLFDCAGGVATSNSDQAAVMAAVANDSRNVVGQSSLASRIFPGANEAAVTPVNAATIDSFFDTTSYIGAFSPTDTETSNWAAGWTFGLFPPPACPTGTIDSGSPVNGLKVCNLSGRVRNDLRLVRGNIYRISGRVDIGEDVGANGQATSGDPASLTVESGVTLFGASGSDYIVVNRGSKLFSNGTATNPVVFTSEKDLLGTQADPVNAMSEWGGLVILGRAPINRCRDAATPGTVNCENIIEGVTNPEAIYGGDLANDDSGDIRYTQVRYAGFAINTQGNELNGITFGGVGSGTEVDYVQVHNNSDDGVEFFGGRVNVRHLVLTGNDDDSIDTDNGYQGKIQFAIVTQRSGGGDNIVEASSSAPGVAPLSSATLANFTFVGRSGGGNAWRMNTGTVGRYVNGVVNHPGACMRWESSAGDGVAGYNASGDPRFDSILFDCDGGLATSNSDTAAATASVSGGTNNLTAQNTLTGTFVNGTAETAATPFDVTTLDPFFVSAPYVGAVRNSTDRWWAGWSCGLEAATPC